MAEVSKVGDPSIIDVAGAGFRLSLVLNAVGVEIANTDVEIQSIARAITSFALILKQVGLSINNARSIASTSAKESAKDIAAQSQTVFDEIKGMVEMVQKKDESGHIQSIAIAQRVKWCFKKQRVHYLLGQLEVLKFSLSLMLQVLQMGRLIADSREDPAKPRIHRRDMLQDRAEIQNMVVVRYWSLVDLSRLYELAEHETSSNEPQLSEFDRIEHPGGDARLSIEPAPRDNKDDQSKALVKYQETPLNQLNDQMTKAMTRADHLLHAPKDDIVDQLLDEWTRLRHIQARHQPRRHRYGPHYETDTSDLSSSDFQGAKREKGYYLENGNKSNGTHQNIKNVRFRARVESDSSDSGSARGVPRGKKYARRHVLHSDESTTSNESDTSDTDSPPPRSRRSSDTTTAMNTATNSKYRGPMNGRAGDGNGGDRPRRPYTSGDGARPVSRGSAASPIPQQAQPGQQQYPPYQPIRGATMPNPSHGQWLGGSGSQAPPSPGLRPPSQGGYYPQQQQQQPPQQLRRTPSYGVPQQQQQMAPSSPHLNPYIPRPPSQQLPTGFSTDRSLQPPPPHHHHSHPHHQQQLYRQQPSEEDRLREKEERRQRRREKERQKEIAKARKKAGLDEKGGIKQKAKKGLIGAGAVAGLMDILQGLDGL